VGEGSNYASPNYKFHSEQGYDEWIYMDRIVVDEDYQSMSIGSKLYTYLI
jgi:predicted GNAT superfamily acetyltransferase